MTPLRILELGRASTHEWDAAFERCAYATFFQSRIWAEIWLHGSEERLTPRAQRVRFSDGAVAILPFSGAPLARGWLTRHVAPAGTYGGWISSAPLGREHAALLARLLVGRLGDVEFRMSPFAPHGDVPELPLAGRDETQVVDLAPGFEQVLRLWSKGHRAAARQALRAGVEVAPAEGLADWHAYHEVYRETRARWGERADSDHGLALFEEIARRAGRRATLWLARVEGRLAAGALCLYAPNHVVYWHGAAREEFFPQRPVHLLLREAMRDAALRGLRWFDFNPSGGHEGVARFKRGFGTRTLAVPRVRCQSRAARAAARTRRWLSRGPAAT